MKLFDCIFLKCRSILLTLLSMIVSNKWQFSQLKCDQLPRALRFAMYIRFSRDFKIKLQNETKNFFGLYVLFKQKMLINTIC
jgi:hypothetical protein